MKTVFFLFSLIVSVSPLLGQSTAPATDTSYPNIAATTSSNRTSIPKEYSLASSSNPVVVNEYCTFLNLYAARDGYYYYYDNGYYYDANLMDPSSPNACIIRSGTNGSYTYHAKEDIDGDSYQITSTTAQYAQKAFRDWRKNPTVAELCRYANDKLNIKRDILTLPSGVSCSEDATQLKKHYSEALKLDYFVHVGTEHDWDISYSAASRFLNPSVDGFGATDRLLGKIGIYKNNRHFILTQFEVTGMWLIFHDLYSVHPNEQGQLIAEIANDSSISPYTRFSFNDSDDIADGSIYGFAIFIN